MDPKKLTNKSGTPGYLPPEMFKYEPFTDKGDVFALGVVFYSIITGVMPF
jgi:serine/threonine protein kinase